MGSGVYSRLRSMCESSQCMCVAFELICEVFTFIITSATGAVLAGGCSVLVDEALRAQAVPQGLPSLQELLLKWDWISCGCQIS